MPDPTHCHPYTWLANVMIVKKANDQWRMCTNFTALNKVVPKDAYPLPRIDNLVDGASRQQIFSFLDAYSGYNQIPMFPPNREKIAFITEQANFWYEVILFGLKNAGATYQRFMDRVFHHRHVQDLKEVFAQVHEYGMKLNSVKCTFGVLVKKFLGFMLTVCDIEANIRTNARLFWRREAPRA